MLVCIPLGKYVPHGEIRSILPMHPADLSHSLSVLVEHGYLQTEGRARGMKYSWGEVQQMSQAPGGMSQVQKQESHNQGAMMFTSWQMSQLPPSVVKVRTSRKASLEGKDQAISELCHGQWVSMADLLRALDRDRRTLQRILRPMVHHGLLEVRYPRQQNHPQQFYRARQREP